MTSTMTKYISTSGELLLAEKKRKLNMTKFIFETGITTTKAASWMPFRD